MCNNIHLSTTQIGADSSDDRGLANKTGAAGGGVGAV